MYDARTIVKLGWFKIRIPGKTQELWALVADDQTLLRQVVLITSVPLETVQAVQSVYEDWRLHPRIKHGYRFDTECLLTTGGNFNMM